MKKLKKSEIKSIQDIIANHRGYFFSRDAMRFFKCRVMDYVFNGPKGIYFVTSERFVTHNQSNPRRYTVRRYYSKGDRIETIGEFNSLTKQRALRDAKELSGLK